MAGDILTLFLTDLRTQTLFWLVVLDLATGVIAALRTHTFNLRQVGTWYAVNVLPFLLGHAVVFLVSFYGVGQLLAGGDVAPGVAELLPEVVATIGAAPAALALTESISDNLRETRAGRK